MSGEARRRATTAAVGLAAAAGVVGAVARSADVQRAALAVRGVMQAAADHDYQVGLLAQYVRRRAPDARIMTSRWLSGIRTMAPPASDGPGELFEALEELAPADRPSHFALGPGIEELAGDVVFRAPVLPARDPRPGRAELVLRPARWDHAGTGDRPVTDHAGWAIVDRLDVADRASEADHAWRGVDVSGPSLLHREAGPHGLVIDGGRALHGERFRLAVDPARPLRLILRTAPVTAGALRVLDDGGRELAVLHVYPADGAFVEVGVAVPATARLRVEASAPYRAFHWFALQPE
jgi:hypothetical protein